MRANWKEIQFDAWFATFLNAKRARDSALRVDCAQKAKIKLRRVHQRDTINECAHERLFDSFNKQWRPSITLQR